MALNMGLFNSCKYQITPLDRDRDMVRDMALANWEDKIPSC